MKREIVICSLLLLGHASFAQWNLNGSILENTNTGDVVVNSPSNFRIYGRIIALYPKSNTPLGGELLGTSGWWGFRTDSNNTFNLDTYNNNSPKSMFSINQYGQTYFNARKSNAPLDGEIFG